MLLILLWCSNFDTKVYYVVYIGILILLGIWIVINRYKIPRFAIEDKIAISFIIVWLYGVIVGFIRGNQSSYVIANFAGMICYLSYFCFTYFKCKLSVLTSILLWSGLLISLYATVRLLSFIVGFSIPFIESDIGISSTGQFRIYFSTLTVAYPLLGCSLYSFTHNVKNQMLPLSLDNKVISFLILALSVFTFFFVASSKGFLLGGIAIIVITSLGEYFKSFLHGKLNIHFFILVLLLVIIVSLLFYFDYFSIVEKMFDESDSSNSTRYDQLWYILKDCSWMGNGLGATVPGVIRSEEGPYGFELTYINLIHKFGFLSFVLFANWAYMFVALMKLSLRSELRFYAIVALSSLGYMFPSIGNPLLMHPSLVVLNCLTLFYIKKMRENE